MKLEVILRWKKNIKIWLYRMKKIIEILKKSVMINQIRLNN